ncbi:unnamed protein product [Peronospora farinosa]|uniref:Uncharacterized protein n=1 Tax=Peronospora farinosa TaxID=134698 RepID=A0ABN8CF01_9STRA|nr:unnamed protein product [Peronospora farinosa]
MTLWDTDKYRTTGTLFFHDRISQPDMYMGAPFRGNAHVSVLNHYISHFDVTPFAPLGNIQRPKATSENKVPVDLKNYSPSEHLLKSHSWNHRAGHEMDSSLVLWNKKMQPRATAILAAFVAINGINRPPSGRCGLGLPRQRPGQIGCLVAMLPALLPDKTCERKAPLRARECCTSTAMRFWSMNTRRSPSTIVKRDYTRSLHEIAKFWIQ